jgi:hypothetical protein
MTAKTIKGQSTADIRSALQQLIAEGFTPTLAVVFMSIKQDSDAVCKLLEEKGISIFGATTSGEFINNEISEGGIVIMLLDLNPGYFKLLFLETNSGSAYDVSKQLGAEGKKLYKNPAFVMVTGWLHTEGEKIIKGIQDGFGGEVTVFGAMAGDDLTLKDPRVFTSGKNSTTGILAMIIDGNKVNVSGVATCGWRPIGITKTITKSEGNVVYTIDGQPAFDLVIKYLGLNIDDMNAITNTVVNLGAYYPLQLEREDAPPVMRTAMLGNKEDRSLICAGNVPQGAKVRFSLPPDFDVIDTVVNECSALKDEKQNEADALIMFSCISRYLSFGVMTNEELERVQKVWNAPFIGFFSYGEFGKSEKGKHEFHNNTCCVVTLKEK